MFREGWACISPHFQKMMSEVKLDPFWLVKISKHLVKPPPPREALTCISMLTIVEEILNPPKSFLGDFCGKYPLETEVSIFGMLSLPVTATSIALHFWAEILNLYRLIRATIAATGMEE